jgi:hypothetical protein
MPFLLETFGAWLCEHETDIIGESSRNFSCPLANFLTELFGHVMGVDGHLYGRASHQWCQWQPLPRWAIAFTLSLDRQGFRPITGLEALSLLADVELTLSTHL